MEILVFSDSQMRKYIPKNKTSVLRVYQTNKNKELSDIDTSLFSEVKSMSFADICFKETFDFFEQELEREGIFSIKSGDYKDYYTFLERNKRIDTLIIHCSAGISRSPALAIIATWYFKDIDLEKKLIKNIYDKTLPNSYILNRFSEDLNIKRPYLGYESEEDFEQFLTKLQEYIF